MLHSLVINGEGELRWQPANASSPEKMAIRTMCVCVCMYVHTQSFHQVNLDLVVP